MNTKVKILGIAAASLLLAAPALAEGGKYGEKQDNMRQQQQSVNQQGMQQKQARARMSDEQRKNKQVNKQNIQRNISAKVVDTRTITLKNKQGQQEKHVVAKVNLTKGGQNGRSLVLDLGKQQDLERAGVKVKKGDTVEAKGDPGRINGRQVLVVTGLTTEAGKTKQNQ